MSPRRGDDRFGPSPLPQQTGQRGPPAQVGRDMLSGLLRSFSLLVLDEGTCGRRPRVWQLQGVSSSGNQIMPFHDLRFSGVKHVLSRIHYVI